MFLALKKDQILNLMAMENTPLPPNRNNVFHWLNHSVQLLIRAAYENNCEIWVINV